MNIAIAVTGVPLNLVYGKGAGWHVSEAKFLAKSEPSSH
jgi:ABC-type sulfate transport system permease subunit